VWCNNELDNVNLYNFVNVNRLFSFKLKTLLLKHEIECSEVNTKMKKGNLRWDCEGIVLHQQSTRLFRCWQVVFVCTETRLSALCSLSDWSWKQAGNWSYRSWHNRHTYTFVMGQVVHSMPHEAWGMALTRLKQASHRSSNCLSKQWSGTQVTKLENWEQGRRLWF